MSSGEQKGIQWIIWHDSSHVTSDIWEAVHIKTKKKKIFSLGTNPRNEHQYIGYNYLFWVSLKKKKYTFENI